MIIDCHCHLHNEKIRSEYINKKDAEKYLNIRSFMFPTDDKIFYEMVENDENMYVAENADIDKNIDFELKRIAENLKTCSKIKAIKLYPGYQYFYPNEMRLFPIYEFAEKHNLVVVFHQGDVYDERKKAKAVYTRPEFVDDVAVEFPNVKFVISHFAFPYMLETAMIVSKNDNVYTDLSGIIIDEDAGKNEEYILKAYTEDIKKVLRYYSNINDKIMYGTDFCGEGSGLSNIEVYKKLVDSIFEDDMTRDMIYSQNASKLYGMNVK